MPLCHFRIISVVKSELVKLGEYIALVFVLCFVQVNCCCLQYD